MGKFLDAERKQRNCTHQEYSLRDPGWAMSLELYAFLAGELPTREAWQSAIQALGYPVSLDEALTVKESSGFVPCRLVDGDSGFELFVDRVQTIVEEYPTIKGRVQGRIWAISFRWGGNLGECACVMAGAAGLMRSSGAIVYYPDDDLWYEEADLRREFDSCFS